MAKQPSGRPATTNPIGKVSQMRYFLDSKHKDHANADGKMTDEQKREFVKKFEADLITPAEVALWKRGASNAKLVDGSVVTYSWYRFVDQPSFQQYAWSGERKAKLQAFVEKLHANWPIDRDYMAPPSRGKLASFDPALLVTPPAGLEVGYVPIVTRQARQ